MPRPPRPPATLPSAPTFAWNSPLGSGHYGECHLFIDHATGATRAAKTVAHSGGIADPRHEVEALERTQACPHPNVVRFFGHSEIDGGHLLVFECIDGGDVFDHVIDMLSEGAPVPIEIARPLFRQIARGIAHLHTLGIAHLDVKLENCMISADKQTVSVVDLGLWHDLSAGVVVSYPYRGSPAYMSPEVFANRASLRTDTARFPYDGVPADVWSLGICLFVMVMGFYPLDETPRASNYHHLALAQAGGLGALEATCGEAAASHYPQRAGYAPSRARQLRSAGPDAAALLDMMLVAEPSGRAPMAAVLSSGFVGDNVPSAEPSASEARGADAAPPPVAPPPPPPAAPSATMLPSAPGGSAEAERDSGGVAYRAISTAMSSAAVDSLGAAAGRCESAGPPLFHGLSAATEPYVDDERFPGRSLGVFLGGGGELPAAGWCDADDDDESMVPPAYRSAADDAGAASGARASAPPLLRRQHAVSVGVAASTRA